ncbi:LCP family protein [Leuconostoc fallax]|uniref:Cell envelope-related transcriptional attenuator domain-containing protein n=1 Tax=Leuconostoc fallax TaxID=1251 RepID=A0A4R5N8C4_9LACO|nr:LCP family protein [Leuconostoc fallax]MBU7455201.1 LCP family protein [Leuconostoc fallax]MCO6183476.1 LCP family protein [Leuconostoc fallax]TDG67696.1 hypothetical protein C5L23_001495 [Leuconostoc fallax]
MEKNTRQSRHEAPKKKHTLRKIILSIVALLIIGIIGTGAYAFFSVNSTISKMQNNSKYTNTKQADKATSKSKPITYLLLGTDTGELGRDYKGRTDTMMVMSANPKLKSTTIMSIPRDTYVKYQGSPIKINAAYTYGSETTAIDAVQDLLGIKIDGYALINMGGLEKMVNAVGGVDVTSPLTFTYEGESFVKGQTYHLDGSQALKFSRMRYDDPQGDYGRQNRQQLIIESVLKNSANVGTLFNSSLLNTMSNNIQTDISTTSLKNLALNYRGALGNIKQDHLQGNTQMIDGQSFEVVPQSELTRAQNVILKQQGKTTEQ